MKKIVALALVFCFLCLSLAGCSAKAKEPTEEEYLAWAEKAWNASKAFYDQYGTFESTWVKLMEVSYKNNSGETIYPNIDFLLLDDFLKVSEDQANILKNLNYFESDGVKAKIQHLQNFVNTSTMELSIIQNERESFANIPEEYSYLDTELMLVINRIFNWHADIIELIKDGSTSRNIIENIERLEYYEIDEEIFDTTYKTETEKLKKTNYTESTTSITKAASEIAVKAAGGIEYHMEVLETLLG